MTITIISTLRDRTPVPQPDPLADAQVIWGSPANFSWGSKTNNFSVDPTPRTNISFPDGGSEEPPPEDLTPIIYNWTEVSRRETVVRINGPSGAYVDFARIDELTFRLPDQDDGRQVYVVQTFKNSTDAVAATTATSPLITPKFIKVPKSTA